MIKLILKYLSKCIMTIILILIFVGERADADYSLLFIDVR
jgi:hypothetical protein